MRHFAYILCFLAIASPLSSQVVLLNQNYSAANYSIPALAHTPGAGSDRVLLFMSACEYETPPAIQITSVSYGGQAMTFAGNQQIYTAAGNCWAEVEVYYLLESQIVAATSTAFAVNYSGTSVSWRAIKHCAATFANVDQATPLGQISGNSNSNIAPVSTGPLSGNTGDMLVAIVSGGNTTNYSIAPAGFNAIERKSSNTHAFAAFNKNMQCGVLITPTVTSASTMNRQSLLALVLKYNNPAPPISLSLGSDTSLCNDETLILDATTPGSSYTWQDNSSNALYTVTSEGVYFVKVISGCDTVTDSIAIGYEDCDCGLYMPNSFTPNNDAVNEHFGPVFNCRISEYNLIIFNRWGQEIFETSDPTENWKGTYKNNNQPVPIGVYPYVLGYKLGREERRETIGRVNLIR